MSGIMSILKKLREDKEKEFRKRAEDFLDKYAVIVKDFGVRWTPEIDIKKDKIAAVMRLLDCKEAIDAETKAEEEAKANADKEVIKE